MRTFKQLARELAISLRGDVWWAELWSGMTALCWALFSLRYQHELAPSMQMPVRLGDAGIWQLLSFALGSAQEPAGVPSVASNRTRSRSRAPAPMVSKIRR